MTRPAPETGTEALISAATVLTMDPSGTRAEAVVVNTHTGIITAVGTDSELTAQHPNSTRYELGDVALTPGFIDAHSHPILSGMVCEQPCHWIAPYVGFPHYSDVTAPCRAHPNSPTQTSTRTSPTAPSSCSITQVTKPTSTPP